MTDTTGAAVERYVYDPYGKATIYDATWSAMVSWANSEQNEILYCGYRFDPETGLYHVRNRMYHTTLGRWLQRDPKGYVDGMGLYEYVRSSPLKLTDAYGLKVLEYKNCDEKQKKAIEAADKAGTQRAKDLAAFFKDNAYEVYKKFIESGKGKLYKGQSKEVVEEAMRKYCSSMASLYSKMVEKYEAGYIAVGNSNYKMIKVGEKGEMKPDNTIAEAGISPDSKSPNVVTFYKPFFEMKTEARRTQVSLHETSHLAGTPRDVTDQMGYGRSDPRATQYPGMFLRRMVEDAYHAAFYAAGDVPRGMDEQRYVPKAPSEKAQDAAAIMRREVLQYAVEPTALYRQDDELTISKNED